LVTHQNVTQPNLTQAYPLSITIPTKYLLLLFLKLFLERNIRPDFHFFVILTFKIRPKASCNSFIFWHFFPKPESKFSQQLFSRYEHCDKCNGSENNVKGNNGGVNNVKGNNGGVNSLKGNTGGVNSVKGNIVASIASKVIMVWTIASNVITMKATNVIPTKIVLHQALAGISVSN
jgi:hypothetical protein